MRATSRALVPLAPKQDHEIRADADFAVTIKVRNGRFLAALKRAGYKSVNGFCKKHRLNQATVNQYATMTLSPVNRYGKPTKSIQNIADILDSTIEDMFPQRFLSLCLERTARAEVTMTPGEIGMLLREPPRTPEDVIALEQAAARISNTLILLPPREERLLRLRFGMGPREEKTLEQISEQMGVTRERVRGIEANAIRKLQQPRRAYHLVEPASVLGIGEFHIARPVQGVPPGDAGIRLNVSERKRLRQEAVEQRRQQAVEQRRQQAPAKPLKRPVVFPKTLPPLPPHPASSLRMPPHAVDYYRFLLQIPATEISESNQAEVVAYLENLITLRGGGAIKPYDGFLGTWITMSGHERTVYKYHWFFRNWKAVWDEFPPDPLGSDAFSEIMA